MPEDRKPQAEAPHIALRPDQAPPPGAEDIAAIRAMFNSRAEPGQQARFIQYLLGMCGVHAGESMMSSEAWAFNAGKRWVASTLLGIAETRLVPLGVRKVLEKETND